MRYYQTDTIILQGLNKITAKTSTFTLPIGAEVKLGSLEIRVRSCWKSPPESLPNNKALIEVLEHDNKIDNARQIFYGWIISSSPSLNSLEHQVYDIKLIDCRNRAAR